MKKYEEEYIKDVWRYAVDNEGAVITGYLGNEKIVNIPPVLGGRPVIRIGERAFDKCDNIGHLRIPDSVRSIGESAFCGCKGLLEIKLPAELEEIEDYAFEYCSSLNRSFNGGRLNLRVCRKEKIIDGVSFYIPDKVKRIGTGAFLGCSGLGGVYIPAGVEEMSVGSFKFFHVDSENKNYCSFGGNLFSKDGAELIRYGCKSKCESYKIPRGVERIGENAFSFCKDLVEVIFPDTVTEIGDSAFSMCDRLCNVKFSGNVKNICDNAFSCCKSLHNITIPESVEEIGENAFGGTDELIITGKSGTCAEEYARKNRHDFRTQEGQMLNFNNKYDKLRIKQERLAIEEIAEQIKERSCEAWVSPEMLTDVRKALESIKEKFKENC